MNTDTYALGRDTSYVDWPAIAAGAVIATALSLLLIGFGAGLGLSLTSPYRSEGVPAAWVAIAAGIWLAWVMVTGFGAGGYVVGRMRRKAGDATADEVEARDGLHGLVVWGAGLLVGAVLAATGAGSLLTAGGAVIGKAADVATQAATEAASSDYFANLMLRGVPSAATSAPISAVVDPGAQAQIAALVGRSLSTGTLADRDLDYLAQVVAANSGLDASAARTRVDAVLAEIAQTRTDALAVVEKTRIAGIVFGFIGAATLLLGAVAAFFAATAGGRHRDAGLGFDLTARRP